MITAEIKELANDVAKRYYDNDDCERLELRDRVIEIIEKSEKHISINEFMPSTKNQYVDELVLVCVKNKNKEDGILLWDVCSFDGESWSKRFNTYETIIGWRPITRKY